MFDKIFDLIAFPMFLLFAGIFIPWLLVCFCWLIIWFLKGITPVFVWKWMLRDQNLENIRDQVQEYKEGKVCRPMFVGLVIGMLFALAFVFNLRLKEKIFYLLIFDAGLIIGIVWQIFYFKNHGDEMDSR